MARSRARARGDSEAPKRSRGRPPADPESARRFNVHIRSSEAWRAWLTELAERERTSTTGLIDRALAELARRVDFREPPPR